MHEEYAGEPASRVLDIRQHEDDGRVDGSLRPKSLADFIGQAELKNKL